MRTTMKRSRRLGVLSCTFLLTPCALAGLVLAQGGGGSTPEFTAVARDPTQPAARRLNASLELLRRGDPQGDNWPALLKSQGLAAADLLTFLGDLRRLPPPSGAPALLDLVRDDKT